MTPEEIAIATKFQNKIDQSLNGDDAGLTAAYIQSYAAFLSTVQHRQTIEANKRKLDKDAAEGAVVEAAKPV